MNDCHLKVENGPSGWNVMLLRFPPVESRIREVIQTIIV